LLSTFTCIVEKVKGAEKNYLLKFYLLKHPHLKKFVTSPSCALLRVKVHTYYVVSRFQKVMALDMIEYCVREFFQFLIKIS